MIPAIAHNSNDCRPVGEILTQIGGKWTVLVIARLDPGPKRFGELKREIGSISQKMLTATLRDLEKDGFVTRAVTPVIPLRVDYELTDLGRDLLVPVGALGKWAIENRQRVLEARTRFAGAPTVAAATVGQVRRRPGFA